MGFIHTRAPKSYQVRCGSQMYARGRRPGKFIWDSRGAVENNLSSCRVLWTRMLRLLGTWLFCPCVTKENPWIPFIMYNARWVLWMSLQQRHNESYKVSFHQVLEKVHSTGDKIVPKWINNNQDTVEPRRQTQADQWALPFQSYLSIGFYRGHAASSSPGLQLYSQGNQWWLWSGLFISTCLGFSSNRFWFWFTFLLSYRSILLW